MSAWTFYHNPNCSKSREAFALLKEKGVDFKVVEYLKTPLSRAELQELANQLTTPVSSLVRTKEDDYIQTPFDVNSVGEVIAHLEKYPRLMERPILQGNGRAVIGRPTENILTILLKD
ncbi:arsenate reductase family protein [Bdellovibrio sp. 22V]|uniref:arsenate reductase family protein n=1 Tax=Bdellovibrio sp. 22V TaxID=3044166 RepID=UPI002543E424|nr:arsenate reductase family protein [Bdellovibrio sp. 22V]WII72143.1 arsenate reductase family protein [Bdellovibrio sp. 22V]